MEGRPNQQHWALIRKHQKSEMLQKKELVSQVRDMSQVNTTVLEKYWFKL